MGGPLLRVLYINAGGLLVLLLAAELIFGNWIFGPKFGTLNLPRNVSRTFDTTGLYAGGGTVNYTRDEYGLRGRYPALDQIDLLVLGGSTTNELYIDDRKTWASVIAREAARDGKKWVVVNAGVDGQSTVGHLRNFEVWFPQLPSFKPRFVLAYIGINDIALEGQEKFDEMKSPDTLRRVRHYLQNNSAVYGLVRVVRGNIRARSANLIHGGGKVHEGAWIPIAAQADTGPVEGQPASRLEAYGRRVQMLAGRIRELGAEPIFVSQSRGSYRVRDGRPVGRAGSDGGYFQMAAYNQAMLAACRRVRAICIDLGSELEFQDGDFYDHIHTTPSGSARIGRYLYAKLKNRL